MARTDAVLRVLSNVFPDECNALGPTTLREVVENKPAPEIAPEGSAYPLVDLFNHLKEVAEFVVAVLSIYASLKAMGQQKGETPTAAQVKDEIGKKGVERGRISEEDADRIVDDVVGGTGGEGR